MSDLVAILFMCVWLSVPQGLCSYTSVAVDAAGLVNPADVVAALTPNTVLVTVMHSNNEVRMNQHHSNNPGQFACCSPCRVSASVASLHSILPSRILMIRHST